LTKARREFVFRPDGVSIYTRLLTAAAATVGGATTM
jgi:hypothetical protein